MMMDIFHSRKSISKPSAANYACQESKFTVENVEWKKLVARLRMRARGKLNFRTVFMHFHFEPHTLLIEFGLVLIFLNSPSSAEFIF